MSKKGQPYTDLDLYGSSGQPQISDIRQDDIFNCYFVASMGAVAEQQPERIRGAIRYEPDPKDPNAGVFHVTLYHPTKGEVVVPVTQADVEDNIKRNGGGTADNHHKGAPLWPSVLEAGYAKLHDPNPNNNDRKEAYDVIGSPTRGGALSDATFALTGETGERFRYSGTENVGSAPAGNNKDEVPPFRARVDKDDRSSFGDASEAHTKISSALGAGKAVTLSTRSKEVDDGLMENHAYIVTGIEQRKDGVWLTLRNPYAHNQDISDPEKKNTSNPTITVSLDKMLDKGVFGEFNIGPEPPAKIQHHNLPVAAVIHQHPLPKETAPAQPPNAVPVVPASPSGVATLAPLATAAPDVAQDIRSREHLGNARYQQALDAIERSPNVPQGTFTGERLQQSAANLAYASLAGTERSQGGQNERLDRIDFAVFNKQRDGLIAGQGELGAPTARLALLPAAQDNATTLAVASQQVNDALQRAQAQTIDIASRTPQQTQEQSGPAIGPRMV